ncbi:MAG: PrsW family intramembrane metalloprotease [Treponema sp.]|nr:PrsW family intramembrane metalloprotease [Treponema sp.]
MRALFYFVLAPALLPVVLLLFYIYKKDKIEREPLGMILKVFVFGALFSLFDIPSEQAAHSALAAYYPYADLSFELAHNFLGIAFIEEVTKWIVLMLFVWRSREFNYKFDGIVYAATASLGFAALENIIYVVSYGTGVAVSRALFAIPGHASFGILMGFFFARAKHFSLAQNYGASVLCMVLSLACPIFVHGTYDFLLSPAAHEQSFSSHFFVLVIALDALAWLIIRHESRTDMPL